MCVRVHDSQYRESQYLGNGERCNRYLHALRCLVYQWVSKGDSGVVLCNPTHINVHVAVVYNHDSYPYSDSV